LFAQFRPYNPGVNLIRLLIGLAAMVPLAAVAQPSAAPGGTGDGPPIELTCIGTSVPAVVHVRAGVPADLGISVLDTRYEWDFGDAGSKYNQLPGFNAAHVYDKPGTYTITLTVRLSGGKELTRTTWVRIAPDGRKRIHVSADGNDRLDGSTAGRAVRSAGRAFQLAGSGDATVLFRKGDVFDVSTTIPVNGNGIRVGNYARTAGGEDLFKDGVPIQPPPGVVVPPSPAQRRDALPVLRKVPGGGTKDDSIFLLKGADDVLFEGVEFDSVWDLKSEYGAKKVPARGATVGGTNIGFRWCSFRNLTDAINTELRPTGVLVSECTFSDEIRGYGIYANGSGHAYIGNVMRHSRQEHLIRASEPGVSHVLVAYNDLRRNGQGKGSIEFRDADWFYVASNYLNSGTLRVGPQEQDKAATPNWESIKCEWGVIQDNRLDELFFNVRLGTYHVVFRNNVIRNVTEDWSIIIACEKQGYDQVRKAADIRIAHNTVIHQGEKGMFLFVQGTPVDLVVQQNVFIAPNLKPGGSNAGIYATRSLDGFARIEGNIFPTGQGGMHRVNGTQTERPAWQGHAKVKAERYGIVPVDQDDNVPLQSNAGAKLGSDKRERK
jgi:hypothetical protein